MCSRAQSRWWPHDSLHIHNGLDLAGLLAIEYAFHVTLMLAGLILARFFYAVVQQSAQVRVVRRSQMSA